MKKGQRLFVVIFLILCILPSAGMLILPEEENRANQVLAPRPRLQTGDHQWNLQFFSELEAYMKDHFAFRQHFITVYDKLLCKVFATSGTDQVIVGKEGWRYYADSAPDFLNIPTMTERQAANAAISLSLMQEYTLMQGARFLFIIAPNKNSIYPQYMPDHYIPAVQEGNLERMRRAMESCGMRDLDLFESLRASPERLYHQLDSHWNDQGAALVQQILMRALGMEGTDYSQKPYQTRRNFSGDLYEMLYPEGNELDENQDYGVFTYQVDGAASPDSIRYQTSNPSKEHSLVMFRDSFGNALSPFLAEEFADALFSRAVPYQMDLIGQQQADFVILELAERNLKTLSERAPVMEAPQRTIQMPEEQFTSGLEAVSRVYGTYREITGFFQAEEADAGSRIYAVITGDSGTTVYEASPAGEGGQGCFTLYIPWQDEKDLRISLVLTRDGKQMKTETIEVQGK